VERRGSPLRPPLGPLCRGTLAWLDADAGKGRGDDCAPTDDDRRGTPPLGMGSAVLDLRPPTSR